MVKTIWVVDDEKDIRDSVEVILKKEGYKIIKAIDADDALKKYNVKKPDLILLDIMMPGTPVKKIIPKMRGSKIVYLSVVKISDLEKGNLLGKNVCGFIEKPFDIRNLVSEIKKCLG